MFQKDEINRPKSPEEDSLNIFNQASFWWLNDFIVKGYTTKQIDEKDIYERLSDDKAHTQYLRFRKIEKIVQEGQIDYLPFCLTSFGGIS
jgi:hypothetical protein